MQSATHLSGKIKGHCPSHVPISSRVGPLEIAGWVPESPCNTAGDSCLGVSSLSSPDNDSRATCALCGSALESRAAFDLGSCARLGLLFWVLLRGRPGLLVEPVWEPSRLALGLEASRRGGMSQLSQLNAWQQRVGPMCLAGPVGCGEGDQGWVGIGETRKREQKRDSHQPLKGPTWPTCGCDPLVWAGDLNYHQEMITREVGRVSVSDKSFEQ